LVASREPRPGRHDRRGIGLPAVGVADADVETVRRTDVACAQDPHAHQVVCRFRSSSDEVGLGIVEPRYPVRSAEPREVRVTVDRKSTRLNSSHVAISYAVFCLKKKKKNETSS